MGNEQEKREWLYRGMADFNEDSKSESDDQKDPGSLNTTEKMEEKGSQNACNEDAMGNAAGRGPDDISSTGANPGQKTDKSMTNPDMENEGIIEMAVQGDETKEMQTENTDVVMPIDFSMYTSKAEQDPVIYYGMGEITYTAKDIASEFGITPQTVRNYANYFAEYISGERGLNSQRYFTEEDVSIFKLVFELREKKHYTREEIKKVLDGTGYRRQRVNDNKKIPFANNRENEQEYNEENAPAVQQEMITALSDQLQQRLGVGLEKIQNNIITKLNAGIEETSRMRETINEQNELIKKQADEIQRLKSTVGNIGHDTRETIKRLDTISEETKSYTASNGKMKSEILEAIKNDDLIGQLHKAVSSISVNIQKNTDNAIGSIKDQLKTQNQQIDNISKNLQNLKQNTTKEGQNKLKEEQNRVKGEQNATNNSKIDEKLATQFINEQNRMKQLLKDYRQQQSKELEELAALINKTISAPDTEQVDIDEYNQLKDRYTQAANTIKFLADKNGELFKELKSARLLIEEQESKIKDLNSKISLILAMKTQHRG